MKKILFIAPDYYGFSQVVLEGLKKYSGFTVEYINSTKRYQYQNFGEKFYNFFLKAICNKNLKRIRKEQKIQQQIEYLDYDILIVIGPYTLDDKNLEIALKKSEHSIMILWDSIAKIPMQEKHLSLFDVCFSFDKNDCQYYKLNRINNFYFIEERGTNVFDIAYLATYDRRIEEMISIFHQFQKQGINAKAKIFTYSPKDISERLSENIKVIQKIIPFSESYQYYLDSKAILDIAHSNQAGLSFRSFEAMGMRKKLITTNQDIVNYDFYHPNNILVIENPYDFKVPKEFFRTEYQDVDTEIKEKYHIKNWIKNILSIYEKT